MKYLVMLCDGMADIKNEKLGNKTPMECAYKPNMDRMAHYGTVGMVKTVPDTLSPGSDVANLSCMGYDPLKCYTGRSPLEAVSMGIQMTDTDLAFRCNLVTLSDEEKYADKTMLDYSGGDISTEEAAELIKAVEENLSSDNIHFFSGISYRHCMLMSEQKDVFGKLTPPHDISDRVIGEYLTDNEILISLMQKSYDLLKNHEINKKRVAEGKRPANSIWLWGQGTKPKVSNFYETRGLKGSVVSAVDLIKGIGLCAGMTVCDVKGATGYIDTDFEGKAQAAIDEFAKGSDFVYLHVEAPDECGHRGEAENKVKSIELIDEKILGKVLPELEKYGDYKVLVMPDHPTPLCTKTHSSEPVPYLIYQKSKEQESKIKSFCEESAEQNGNILTEGYKIMDILL